MNSRAISIGFVVVLVAAGVSAQNLVQNATFEVSTSGWTVGHPHFTLVWSGEDATASADSGSALVTNTASDPFNSTIYQCVQSGIAVSARYDFGAKVRVPSSGVAGETYLLLAWMSGAGCTGQYLGAAAQTATTNSDSWVSLGRSEIVAPAGAVSAQLQWRLNKTASGGGYQSVFDDIYLYPSTGAVPTQELFLPVAAAKHGLSNTYWSTDGWFANRTTAPVTLAGAFLRGGANNSPAVAAPTTLGTVPANGFLAVRDIATVLGIHEETGGIYLRATASGGSGLADLLVGTSYTYTPNDLGPGFYGQGIPAVGAGAGTLLMVAGAFQSGMYRTNVGALNTSAASVSIEVRVSNASGATVATTTWALLPWAHIQVSLQSLGVASLDGGVVRFRRTSGTGVFRAYASIVDQRTGDSIYNPAR
jgi:hypothetical protein